MDLLSVLPLLIGTVIVLMTGSVILRAPKQDLQSACAEGAIWGSSFFLAFSAEILLLINI